MGDPSERGLERKGEIKIGERKKFLLSFGSTRGGGPHEMAADSVSSLRLFLKRFLRRILGSDGSYLGGFAWANFCTRDWGRI